MWAVRRYLICGMGTCRGTVSLDLWGLLREHETSLKGTRVTLYLLLDSMLIVESGTLFLKRA